jgi:hypothetical protein
MRDIGEGAAMDEGGRTLERLHHVGRDRVLQQRGHGAIGVELLGAHGFTLAGIGDDDIAEPFAQVVEDRGPGRRSP